MSPSSGESSTVVKRDLGFAGMDEVATGEAVGRKASGQNWNDVELWRKLAKVPLSRRALAPVACA